MFIATKITVLSVDDNTVLSVSLSHQQDAPPRHGTKSQLFNIDGVISPALVGDRSLTKQEVPNGALTRLDRSRKAMQQS